MTGTLLASVGQRQAKPLRLPETQRCRRVARTGCLIAIPRAEVARLARKVPAAGAVAFAGDDGHGSGSDRWAAGSDHQ